VNWARAVSIVKDQVTITGKNGAGQMVGGDFSIGGNRKPPNPVTWEGKTFEKADGGGNSTTVSTKIEATMTGDFPPSLSVVVPDNVKLILSQTVKLTFTWPADAGKEDTLSLNNPSFIPLSK
jgi:hypothetical protein